MGRSFGIAILLGDPGLLLQRIQMPVAGNSSLAGFGKPEPYRMAGRLNTLARLAAPKRVVPETGREQRLTVALTV